METFGDVADREHGQAHGTGRNTRELQEISVILPVAGSVLRHWTCRQVDPTMNEAYLILREFPHKLRQLHVSEVNSRIPMIHYRVLPSRI